MSHSGNIVAILVRALYERSVHSRRPAGSTALIAPRNQEAYAATKEEEDRTSAKRREASAAKEAAKTEKAASHYRAWRGGDNSGATSS